jgi:hypothetical protein
VGDRLGAADGAEVRQPLGYRILNAVMIIAAVAAVPSLYPT